jgi:hypothetical protein
LDAIELQSTELEHLPSLLELYKGSHLSEDYDGALVVTTSDSSGESIIPVVLDVNAMAIESYSEKSKRMLLLKHVGMELDSILMHALEEKAEISSYFFIYYMMPLDLTLPKLVVSVISHMNGKANERSNAHLKNLKTIC